MHAAIRMHLAVISRSGNSYDATLGAMPSGHSAKLWLCVGLLLLAACSDGRVHDPAQPPVGQVADAAGGALTADGGLDRDAQLADAETAADAGPADAAAADSGTPLPPPPAVIFDPPSGGFVGPVSLTLSASADENAPIYYTLDGSLPMESSTQYAAPIELNDTTLVRALTPNAAGTLVLVEAVYLALGAEVSDFSSNLPVLVVHMLDADVPAADSHEYVEGVFSVFEPGSDGRSVLRGPSVYTSHLGIKVRGRSTRYQAKHSYTIELRDATGEDSGAPLLGMPKESDWVLYAPYTVDRSLVRNAFAYQLARSMGRYAAHTQFCEVFVESAGMPLSQQSYVGVYSLTERLKRDADRIPIEKLGLLDNSEPNISGGYIFKNDDPDVLSDEFMTAGGKRFVYDTPNTTSVTAEQSAYLVGYLESIERALAASDGIDPTTQERYDDLVDVGSFIDAHIVNELAKNPDAFSFSEYFYKDRLGPVNAGPVWDFDISMGAHDPWGERSQDPAYWGPGTDATTFRSSFYYGLFSHADFEQLYWDRWHELLAPKAGLFNTKAFNEVLDAYAVTLEEAEARNRVRWPEMEPIDENDTPRSLAAEIGAVESWLAQRLTWVSANLDVLP